MKITIEINKSELDKLNKVIGLDYPDTACTVLLEEEDSFSILLESDIESCDIIETLFDDFDTIIIKENVNGAEDFEE